MENSETTKKTTGEKEKVCPICSGYGYVRRERSIDDPDFGTLEICECQRSEKQKVINQRLYQISNLGAYKAMTFDTFDIKGIKGNRDTNTTLEVAFNTSKNYAQHLNGWLLLMGGFGCGKTHLAAAISNEVISLGVETLFLTVPDLLDWLRYTYSSSETTYEKRFEEIRNIHFLVLDDFGTHNATEWAREKLFQIINYRYIHKLPTAITTNLSMAQIEDRVSSRLQDRELVVKVKIAAQDFRNPTIDSGITPISSLTQISDHRTFKNFSTRKSEKLRSDEHQSIEKAFYAAQKFADKPEGWLVLMGSYGTGKTHLAAAISHYRAALGDDPIFTVVPDLLDHLRATFSPTSTVSYDSIFNQIRTAKLLILDDLGTQNATNWAKEKIYQILNPRYELMMPTVITTSSDLEQIDPKIRSRIMDLRVCQTQKIFAPPYQGSKKKK